MATSRAMVFKWLKDTHLNAYPAALPVRDFQRGRLSLARRVLKANGLPPDDESLLVELAFCLLGHAGLTKYFPMSHAVRSHGYTKPELLSFDDILFALDMHKLLISQMGWIMWQPPDEYVMLERRVLQFQRRIANEERTSGRQLHASTELHKDVLLFWANWRELTAEFGQSKVLDGRPFPSVTVVEHQQGTIDFPKFGSNMTAAERMLESHIERIRRPLYEDDCQQDTAHRHQPRRAELHRYCQRQRLRHCQQLRRHKRPSTRRT